MSGGADAGWWAALCATRGYKMSRLASLVGAMIVGGACASSAAAQEITHQFVSPTFGGNAFNSSHLLAIAGAQRPDKKSTATGSQALTQGQLFAQQIQSRLLSALSSSLVEAITGSNPGTTGSFVVGDQTISFDRTLTQVTVTITDNNTGEVTTITVPVLNFNNSGGIVAPSALAQSAIPESPLTPGSLTTGSVLDSGPLSSPLLAP